MSYTTRIIEYMRAKGNKGMTAGECRDNIGTTEFRKRVSELRRAGYVIVTQWETGPNSNGTTSRYCRYFLIKEPDFAQKPKKVNMLDKTAKALYNYDYMKMLDNLYTITRGENKKNDIQNI